MAARLPLPPGTHTAIHPQKHLSTKVAPAQPYALPAAARESLSRTTAAKHSTTTRQPRDAEQAVMELHRHTTRPQLVAAVSPKGVGGVVRLGSATLETKALSLSMSSGVIAGRLIARRT